MLEPIAGLPNIDSSRAECVTVFRQQLRSVPKCKKTKRHRPGRLRSRPRPCKTPNLLRQMRCRRSLHRCLPNLQISSNGSRANNTCKTSRISRTSRGSRTLFLRQYFDRNNAASGDRHDTARLCVFGVVEIADALTNDLDLIIVLQQPPDRCALDRPRLRQCRQILPGRKRLGTILPTDDDERTIVAHWILAMMMKLPLATDIRFDWARCVATDTLRRNAPQPFPQ